MIDNNALDCNELLSNAVWAYQTLKRSSIGTTPYALVYGHDIILSLEVTVQSLRVAKWNSLSYAKYKEDMMPKLDDLDEVRVKALNSIAIQKQQIAITYSKKIKAKTF